MLRKIWLMRNWNRGRDFMERVVLVQKFEDGTALVEREHGLDLETVPFASLTPTNELEEQGVQIRRKPKRRVRKLDDMVDEYEYDRDEGFVNFW